MTIRLNRTAVVAFLGLATLLASGLVYATVIQRDLPGTFMIGQVQAAEETIPLYEQIQPSSADLTEVNFGTLEIDAFGNIIALPNIPFWAANGGSGGCASQRCSRVGGYPDSADGPRRWRAAAITGASGFYFS